MVFCYRGDKNLSTTQNSSTRIVLIALAIALAGAALAAPTFASVSEPEPDLAQQLPAGALQGAASLYLREASSSPVRWQRWGAESLALARRLKRPVLLDIGAVWCHWCHVMDETTYADRQLAALINRRFVPVKVDCDERPDIDGYYQNAAQAFGAGGWPLTCFITPDGAPILIAGYMPPDAPADDPRGTGMTYVVGRVADAYASDPGGLTKAARAAAAKIAADASSETGRHGSAEALRNEILASMAATHDRRNGGFGLGPGPRFYDFPAIRLALAHGSFGHPDFTAMALDSLRKMAAGGVYDQLGGGFHRYSTDPQWRVPHFEKMGSDQAMAIAAYAAAYQASGDDQLARVLRKTLGYVNSTLLDPKTRTFYSHQDADSFPGDDGSYYTWTMAEVESAMKPDEVQVAALYFGLTDDPARAPDGRIVLRRASSPDQIAKQLKLGRGEFDSRLTRAVAAMVAVRERRRVPKVDRTVLVDRNALMASAYLSASAALHDDSLRRIALDDLDFIIAHARASDGSYYHVWANGRAEVPGLAADQVYMLDAVTAAYQTSREPRYLKEARALADLVMKQYRDTASGLLENRPESNVVPAPMKGSAEVLFDHPMPSVQATAAIALRILSALTADKRYDDDAKTILAAAPDRVSADAGTTIGTLGLALEQRADNLPATIGSGIGRSDKGQGGKE